MVVEPPPASGSGASVAQVFEAAKRRYEAAVLEGGAVLLAVYRGRMSEGGHVASFLGEVSASPSQTLQRSAWPRRGRVTTFGWPGVQAGLPPLRPRNIE